MGSVNKVILLGRLGAGPEVRYTQDQTPVASFNIATSINYKNKSGEKVDKTSWHRCVAWRKTGEVIGQYFKKGNQIYIEGSLESRSYEDKSGEKKFITEVVVNNFQFVDSKGGGSTQTDDDNFLDDFDIESSSSDDVPF